MKFLARQFIITNSNWTQSIYDCKTVRTNATIPNCCSLTCYNKGLRCLAPFGSFGKVIVFFWSCLGTRIFQWEELLKWTLQASCPRVLIYRFFSLNPSIHQPRWTRHSQQIHGTLPLKAWDFFMGLHGYSRDLQKNNSRTVAKTRRRWDCRRIFEKVGDTIS